MKQYILFILFIALTISCSEENGDKRLIAIDGNIETGESAQVTVSLTLPINGTGYYSTKSIVVTGAKVTISDGEHEEILIGRYDKKRFPPFYYYSASTKGEVGKTYHLKVSYGGIDVTSQTSIPEAVDPISFKAKPVAENDSMFYLNVLLQDPPGKQYYKAFTKIKGKDDRFYASLLFNIDDQLFENSQIELAVHKGLRAIKETDLNTSFNKKDTIIVKIVTMPYEAYLFWDSYEKEIINYTNPLFPSTNNLPSNITNGIGNWCGYGINKSYQVSYQQIVDNQPLSN